MNGCSRQGRREEERSNEKSRKEEKRREDMRSKEKCREKRRREEKVRVGTVDMKLEEKGGKVDTEIDTETVHKGTTSP